MGQHDESRKQHGGKQRDEQRAGSRPCALARDLEDAGHDVRDPLIWLPTYYRLELADT